tara:strand:+ start:1676 stop:2992 length:1317 start_codon:yes stop_codon:yes gene_type:complete
MFNYNSNLNQFYNDKVRLKDTDKSLIRGYKDINIQRIVTGINKINQEENKSYPIPLFIEQGSIAMSTTNQSEDNVYDIDVAVIFPKVSFFNNPLESRKFVKKALLKNTVNFSKPPEARTNAVTVWYSEGYHVDFAVYRTFDEFSQVKYEHASTEWLERNPKAITEWFLGKVSSLSPDDYFSTVEKSQLRKITRLLKKFCKSRLNWNLPGGFILSILVIECYTPNLTRDDISFIQTLSKIRNRLKQNRTIYNPVNPQIELTLNKSLQHQLTRLSEKLDRFISRSEVLNLNDCNEEKASDFYKWVFNIQVKDKTLSYLKENMQISKSAIIVSVHRSKTFGAIMHSIPSGKLKIHKKLWLKFTLASNIQPPFDIKWIVENDGDEAKAIPDLGHESWDYNCTTQTNTHWERTAYKGIHKLNAEIYKSGTKVETQIFEVKIIK